MRQHLRWPKALHLLVALVSLALGIMLLLAGLTVQQIAMVTGIGIAAAGITLALRGFGIDDFHEDRGDDARSAASTAGVWIVRFSGLALVVVGALMALWPDAGAAWLAA